MNEDIPKNLFSRSVRFFAALATFALVSSPMSARAVGDACLGEAAGGDLNCTAEDIAVAFVEVTGTSHDCQFIGDTFTFNGILHVESHATQRYDIGFYLGPDALNSTNNDCTVAVIDPALAGGTQDGDVCGDISSSQTIGVPVSNVTAECADTNGDGFFDISVCSTWRQNADATDCPTRLDALPGTKSKCNCETVETTLPIPQCTSNADCVDNSDCTDAVCDPSNVNADGFGCTFPFTPSTTICRASTGVCDPAERCTGSSATCPSDSLSPSTTTCRASTGVCDLAENCTGSSAACPADDLSPTTVVCRASTGVCDPAENCTGASGACPADTFTPSTTVCRASGGVCDVAENCTGSSGACPTDTLLTSTTTCRTTAGVCDIAEVCNGASPSCPNDSFVASTTECRASGGVCDTPESCSGTSATCPADSVRGTAFVCRASAGVCDVADICNGVDKTCPTDQFTASTVTCRPGTGVCDGAELCTGSSATCPDDSFLTTPCRPSAGVCDTAEFCTGSAGSCPDDSFVPSTTECRASGGVCDTPENCTGSSATCPIDAFQPSTLECRPSSGVCDTAENCTGNSAGCPTDAFRPSTTVCRASTGECDVAENCTGSAGGCPADGKQPNGTQCTADTNVCTDDICTDGQCTHPNNTSPCEDGQFCTVNDVCTNGTCSGTPRVCADNVDCNVDTCDEVEDRCDFSECEPLPTGAICRSPGFWATHSGTEGKKGTGINVTQELLDAVGPIQVCGETLSTTSGATLSSVLEALCVRVQGVQQRQLFRQLVAAALNCAVSGELADCDTIIPEFSECSDVCEGTAAPGSLSEGECIALLDCFNNGGTIISGQCATGTCASQPTINCGADFGACPLLNGLPQACVPFEDNCHDQDLCNEDIGFCPDQGPASSTEGCRLAQSDTCTIDSCP
ncbi:MAG TPA: hypothetical protein VN634_05380 [Candidatus Limnocylindrales bacterium]|nr:hypothetical protein [Candidatus Limnocylindrales bacterium]